jgi:hypothetical protein
MRMLIGRHADEPGLAPDELRERRVLNARRVGTWMELDAADLVRRGGRYWVSATTDEVFTRYAGYAFDRSGVVVHSERNPLRFFVTESQDVVLLERAGRTWSEMVYARERAKARHLKAV